MALPDEYVARPCRGGMRNYKMNEVRNPSKEVGNHWLTASWRTTVLMS